MGTIAQVFRPHTTASDVPNVGAGDFRLLEPEAGDTVNDNLTTKADLGTSGAKTIWLDPFTTSTDVTANRSDVGWLINLDGALGMDVPAHAERRKILSGTYRLEGRVVSSALAVNDVFIKFRLYKRLSDASRTLIQESSEQNLGKVPVGGTGVDVSATAVPEQQFVDGETLLLAIAIRGTGQALGINISFRVNFGLAGSDTFLTIPVAGVASIYERSSTPAAANGLATRTIRPRLTRLMIANTVVPAPIWAMHLIRAFTANTVVPPVLWAIKKPLAFVANTIPPVITKKIGLVRAFVAGTTTFDPVKKIGLRRTITAPGLAVMTRLLTLFRDFTTASNGLAEMVRRLVLRREISDTGAGIATKTLKVGLVRAMTAGSDVTRVMKVGLVRLFVAGSDVTRRIKVGKFFSTAANGLAEMVRRLVLRRTITAVANATSLVRKFFLKIAFENLPPSDGSGGTTIIKKVRNIIFDD